MIFCENDIIKKQKKFSESRSIVDTSIDMKSLNDKIFRNLLSLERGLNKYISGWTETNGNKDEFIEFKRQTMQISMILDRLERFPLQNLSRVKPEYFGNDLHIKKTDDKFKLKPNIPIRMFKDEITF
jgi:hypothetical protein